MFKGDDKFGMNLQYSQQEGRIEETLSKETTSAKVRQYVVSNFSVTLDFGFDISGVKHPKENKTFFDCSVFLDPTVKSDVVQIENSYLNKLELSEQDSTDLAKEVAAIYDVKPNWGFLPHQDFHPSAPSRFSIVIGKRRIFLDDFGDGLHYGLAILAAAKTRKNTALFIRGDRMPSTLGSSKEVDSYSSEHCNRKQLAIIRHNARL